MVTHEHNSVPFNVASDRASLDLKPSAIETSGVMQAQIARN